MIEKLAFIFLGLAVGSFIVWLLTERTRWQGMYYSNQYALDSANDRASDAEREAQSYQEQLAFQRKFLESLYNKPVIAALSDNQFSGLVQHVTAAMAAASAKPSDMN